MDKREIIYIKVVFVIAIAILFFIGGITYKHVQDLSDTTKMVVHTYDVSLELEKIFLLVKKIEVARREFLLVGDSSYSLTISHIKDDINTSLKNIEVLVVDNQYQGQNLVELKQFIAQKIALVDNVTHLQKGQVFLNQDMVDQLRAGNHIVSEIEIVVNRMIEHESGLMVKRKMEYKDLAQYTPLFIYGVLLISLVVLSYAFRRTLKSLHLLKTSNDDMEISLNTKRIGEEIGKYGSWRWNPSKNEWFFSENFLKLYGLPPKKNTSIDTILEHIHPDDLPIVEQAVDRVLNLEDLIPFSFRIVKPTGETIFARALGRLVYSDSKKLVVGCTLDITEEVKKAEELENRNLTLEANNKELQAFNYIASHDLQEPLRKIETFISRLIEKDIENLSDNGKQYVSRMQASIGRMRILINDLLQFSRTTRVEKVFETSNLNDLLEAAKFDLQQMIEEKKAIITSVHLPNSRVIPFQIQQLFANLLNNSLKYSQANIPPYINITIETIIAKDEPILQLNTKAQFYKIKFQDNGIGFDKDYANKIFELFTRLHNKDEYSGTGIGLAICKKIVENHKGYIFAEGEPNVGAAFTVYLPVW